jgi:hypothetical protein
MKESLSLLRNYNKARYPLLSSGFSHGPSRLSPTRRGCGHSLSGIRKDRTPTRCYEPTREAAMAAFAKSWRRE